MARSTSRWKVVAALALGLAGGIALAAGPATGHVAGWAHNWTKHIRPKADARYLPDRNLPRGRTMSGTFAVEDLAPSSSLFSTSISFGRPLRTAPAPHMMAPGSPPTAACPGSAASPRAAIGHLCLYQSTTNNVIGSAFANPTGLGGLASRWGTIVRITAGSNGQPVRSFGTWAVRAP